MTLIGQLHSHIPPNGQILIKAVIVIIALSLLLGGCSAKWWVGDGRGDWTLDVCSGYYISKINSREILFVHKAKPDDSGSKIIIPNYFVTAFQTQEPYIFLEGIQTEKITISDDELDRREIKYYIVNSIDGTVIGPFETYDALLHMCNSLALEIQDEWSKTEE